MTAGRRDALLPLWLLLAMVVADGPAVPPRCDSFRNGKSAHGGGKMIITVAAFTGNCI